MYREPGVVKNQIFSPTSLLRCFITSHSPFEGMVSSLATSCHTRIRRYLHTAVIYPRAESTGLMPGCPGVNPLTGSGRGLMLGSSGLVHVPCAALPSAPNHTKIPSRTTSSAILICLNPGLAGSLLEEKKDKPPAHPQEKKHILAFARSMRLPCHCPAASSAAASGVAEEPPPPSSPWTVDCWSPLEFVSRLWGRGWSQVPQSKG